MRRKKFKIFKNGIIAITVVVLVIIIGKIFLQNNDELSVNNEPIDVRFANFQEVGEKYNDGQFQVKLLTTSTFNSSAFPNPIRAYQSINDEIIIFGFDENEAGNDLINIFKISKEGLVIDSLKLNSVNSYPQLVDDYMLFLQNDESFYTNWPKNGDSTKHKIVKLNSDFFWDNEKIIDYINENMKSNAHYFFDSYTLNGSEIKQFYFYKDEKWQVISQKMTDYYHPENEESIYKYDKELFRTGEESPYLKNVTLLNFHKDKKIKYDHRIGGGSSDFSVSSWRGTGFFQAKLNSRNFNFAVKNIVVENEKFDGFQNRYYLVPDDFDYALHFEANFYMSPNDYALFSSKSDNLYLITNK